MSQELSRRKFLATTAVTDVYMVSVVWQGVSRTAVPSTTCGQNLYDSEPTRRAGGCAARP